MKKLELAGGKTYSGNADGQVRRGQAIHLPGPYRRGPGKVRPLSAKSFAPIAEITDFAKPAPADHIRRRLSGSVGRPLRSGLRHPASAVNGFAVGLQLADSVSSQRRP